MEQWRRSEVPSLASIHFECLQHFSTWCPIYTSLPFHCVYIPWLRCIMHACTFLRSLQAAHGYRTHLRVLQPLFLLLSLPSSLLFHSQPTFTLSPAPASSLHGRRECVCSGWKGEEGGVVFYTCGLWRNLPVHLELREEEPVGCGTTDKGDTYTLTPDHWRKRRGRQLEILTFRSGDNPPTPGATFCFCCCVFWKTLSESCHMCFSAVWIHL